MKTKIRSGIYKITINDKMYVGMTINPFYQRWASHRHCLRKGTHRNIHLQRAYDKFGDIGFEVLEECDEWVGEKEEMWIDKLNTFRGDGYNLTGGGDQPSAEEHASFGKKRPEHSKAMSGAGNGRWVDVTLDEIIEAVLSTGFLQRAQEILPLHRGTVARRIEMAGLVCVYDTPDGLPSSRWAKIIDVKKA